MAVTVRPKVLERFWRFVDERQLIWYRRNVLKEKRPWTKDPTLEEFQFTNVYRELDRGTLYLTEEILPMCQNDKDALFNIIIYRLFNHIPTYEFLCRTGGDKKGYLYPFKAGLYSWKGISRELQRWNAKGNSVFTSAFTVTGAPFAGSTNKIVNICYLIQEIQDFLYGRDFLWWKDIWNAPTMEEAFKMMGKVRGFGPFLSYEVVIDINYAHGRWGENSFVNPGPGAKRGINNIYPNLHTREEYIWAIKHLQKMQHIEEILSDGFPWTLKVPKELSLRNIEHSLCEFQKYEKRRKGIRTGRARVFYPNKAPLPGGKKKVEK